ERSFEGRPDQEIPIFGVIERSIEAPELPVERPRQEERMQRNVVGEEQVVGVEVERVLERPGARLPLVPLPTVLDRDRVRIDDGLRTRTLRRDQSLEVIREAAIVVVQKPDEVLAG